MITDDLYDEVLFDPLMKGADSLSIISGYASAAMAFHFLNHVVTEMGREDLNVHLTIGMTPKDGISRANHLAFQNLVEQDFEGRLFCNYVCEVPPVHSKVYVWGRAGQPDIAFSGSANFSQNAFIFNRQGECMVQCDAQRAMDYYQTITATSTDCMSPSASALVSKYRFRLAENPALNDMPRDGEGIASRTLTLLNQRTGETPSRSGLNWGQRDGREPNQSYINIPANICRDDFFPPRGTRFSVLTDDGSIFHCVRAQDGGKAIETPQNNSLLGIYFRQRLGLQMGAYVSASDLHRYGRTNVVVKKIDDENFYMDFSTSS
jgi:hypothetical protein